jgi:prepilin-type N-terminal cleavage/methylation domain-containing protein
MRSRFLMRVASPRLTLRTARRGFTLPEMLIVIVMISVLSIVAIPRFAVANGKRHMQSAKMRVAAAAATARAAAIQKGQQVRFMIKNNRVTVIAITPPKDTIKLISPVPLDTLYGVRVTSGITDSLVVNFSSRGFAALDNGTTIMLKRNGVPADSVVITKTGMVQQ